MVMEKIVKMSPLSKLDVRITKELELRFFGSVVRTYYTLLKSFDLKIEYDNGKSEIIFIERGFKFNGASVPMLLRFLVSPQACIVSALIHDWLYSQGIVSRRKADYIFRCGMRNLDYRPVWRSFFGWAAVRLFGKSCYNSNPKN